MFRRCFSLLWILAVVALVCVAALLSVARTWLPQFGAQRAEVQRWVSEAVGQPVQIDELAAEWRGLYPVLHLRGVRLLDPASQKTLLRFAELRVAVDPYAALYRQRVQVHSLSVIGARLSVERDADGTLGVAGFEELPDAGSHSPAVLAWLVAQPQLSLLRSEIHWRDTRSSAPPLVFSGVDLRFVNNGATHKLAGVTQLPQRLGSSLRGVIDFQGDLANPAQWTGKVYLQGRGLQLATWLQGNEHAGVAMQDGRGDVELWGEFKSLQLRTLVGSIGLHDLRLGGAQTQAETLNELAGRLRWRRNGASWNLDVEDLRVVRGAQAWPNSGFSLRNTVADGQVHLDADFDFLRLQDLSALALQGRLLPDSLHELFGGLAARGDVRDLRLQVQFKDDALQRYYAKARLDTLVTQAWQRLPALSGISGVLECTDQGGRLQLDSQEANIELPALFRLPLHASQLSGDIEWHHYPALWRLQSDSLRASNADVRVETRFALDLPAGGKPFLDLQARYADGDVTAVPRYIPAHIMPPGVVTWLDRAFLGGRVLGGVALFHGRLADFPFDRHDGVFLVSVNVENVGLDYHEGWPKIEAIAGQVNFSGRSLRIDASGGRIFTAQLGPTQVGIADLLHGELQLDGTAQASNADLLRFVRESDLSAHYADYLAGLTVQGDSRLTLSLNLSLVQHDAVPQLLGRVDFKDGGLAIPSLDLGFEGINGPMDFTAAGLFSTGLDARLFGNAVRVTAQAQDGGENAGTRLDMQSHLDIKTLAQRQPSPFWRYLEGGSDYKASLNFSARTAARLHIESALHGVTVRLPVPLTKTAKETRPFTIDMPLSSTGHAVIIGNYGDVLRGAFEISRTAGKSSLARGEIRVGGMPAQLPETPGLRIAGELAQFNLDTWQAALADSKSASTASHLPENINALDVRVQEFTIDKRLLQGLHLWAERQPEQWLANVSSDALTGRVQVPLRFPEGGPVIMALEHLRLDAVKDDAKTASGDPRNLPALQLTAKRFEYQGSDFGALTLTTTRSDTGMQVDKAEVDSPEIKASAKGDWVIDAAGQISRFRIDLTAPKLGLLLGKFGYVGDIKDGQTAARIDAQWPGSPGRFALERMRGKLHVDIKDGRFVDIEPGAGRVFGLLSINELQRRLRLDFSDLFKKGFTFDEISGDFMLDNGDALTSNTTIKGPAARIDVSGRTGLARRDYEQVITVTPHLTSSLPLAGAIANPGIGAALFLAQKLFESQIDAITRYQYTVTGGWDKPVIKRVSQQPPAEPQQ